MTDPCRPFFMRTSLIPGGKLGRTMIKSRRLVRHHVREEVEQPTSWPIYNFISHFFLDWHISPPVQQHIV